MRTISSALVVLCSFLLFPAMVTFSEPKLTTRVEANATKMIQLVKARSQILKFAQPIFRVSVTDPNVVDIIPLSPEQIMINGKGRGSTSIVVWDQFGQEGMFIVQVVNDGAEINDIIQQIAPNEAIQTRVTDDSFVVSGHASSTVVMDQIKDLASAYGYKKENFVDITETPAPQVSLKVRIMEASRQVVKSIQTSVGYYTPSFSVTRLGSAIDQAKLASSLQYLLAGTPKAAAASLSGATNGIIPTVPNSYFNLKQVLPNILSSNNVGGLTTAYTPTWNHNLQTAFDFLETSGKIKTLSEPTLLVSHGKTASFLAGGELPFVAGTDRNGGPILSFKEYGVKLQFSPKIALKTDRISMVIAPEVSSVDKSNCVTGAGGNPVCGFLKRSTETTVDLKNGETLMISGIISQADQQQLQKIPWMGDLPIIGSLFRNSQTSRDERELVVMVTPTIVKNETILPKPAIATPLLTK